jgi:hypothetical protein
VQTASEERFGPFVRCSHPEERNTGVFGEREQRGWAQP